MTEPGKRQWETKRTGYVNWALQQLLLKGNVGERQSVDKLDSAATETATGEDLQLALHSFEAEKGHSNK